MNARGSFSLKGRKSSAAISFAQRGSSIYEVSKEEQMKKVESLQDDLKRRQESYIRRERQYKAKIDELEQTAARLRAEKVVAHEDTDESMKDIRNLHESIISSVGQVQDRTSNVLREQEKDLLRAFRSRLYDVQTELENEKNKTDEGANAWIEKCNLLESEANWAKEMTDRLDRLNQSLIKENLRLKNQFTTQENDREYLVQQLVVVKKDNARLRAEYEGMVAQNAEFKRKNADTATLAPVHFNEPRPYTASNVTISRVNPDAENRQKEIIKRLKRLLEVERRNLANIRAAYANDVQERTELEMFLKECIEDVKKNLSSMPKKQIRDPTLKFEKKGLKELTSADREKVLQGFLNQERVINLLYTKTFPIRNQSLETSTTLESTMSESQ